MIPAISEIIRRCGGVQLVADRTDSTVSAVHKWSKNGIPERHWRTLRGLSDITVEELHHANEAVRIAGEAEAKTQDEASAP